MQLLMLVQKLARRPSVQTCIRSQLGMSHVYCVAQQSAPGEGLHDKAGLHMMPTQVPFQAEVVESLSWACIAVHTLKQTTCLQATASTEADLLPACKLMSGQSTVLLHSVCNKPPVHWSFCHKAHLHGTYQHKIRLAVLKLRLSAQHLPLTLPD